MKTGLLFFCFFSLSLLTSTASFAQQTVQGQGRFNSTSNDSLSFVRSQLLYKAFRDVLSKELQEMGLDAQEFWQKYETRFQKSFESVENKLRSEYGLDDKEKILSSSEMKEFREKLRYKRLSSQSAFGNLARAIESYSIKNMSRSAQAAQSRYLTLEAKVNRRMLNSIYSEFMQEGQPRFFSQLYLTPNFRLREGSWSDLGVKSKVDFTQVVQKHWKNWLAAKLKRSVQEIVVTDEDQVQRIQDFLKIPASNAEEFLGVEKTSQKDDLDFVQGEEVETQKLESSLANSLWLEMTIDIEKIDENLLHGQRSFSYSGKFLLMDLKTREVLLAYDIGGQEHSYQTNDPQSLSSSIASFVYRMPMGGLEELPSTLAKVDSRSQSYVLEIKNLSSIRDLELFNDMLSKEGLTEEFDPQIISFDGVNAQVKLNFKGETPKALSRLRSLHLRSLNGQTTAIVESVERPFEFRLEHRLNPPQNEENSLEQMRSSSL